MQVQESTSASLSVNCQPACRQAGEAAQ